MLNAIPCLEDIQGEVNTLKIIIYWLYCKTGFLYLLSIYQDFINKTKHYINQTLLNGPQISSVQTKAASDTELLHKKILRTTTTINWGAKQTTQQHLRIALVTVCKY